MKNISLIARRSLLYFILIHFAIAISAWVFHSEVSFSLSLSVVCPILCGILGLLFEKTKPKQDTAS